MEENFTFIVNIYDPIKGINRKSYVFLGNVPKKVSDACKAINTESSRKILEDYYGKNYKNKLLIDGNITDSKIKRGAYQKTSRNKSNSRGDGKIKSYTNKYKHQDNLNVFEDNIEELLNTDQAIDTKSSKKASLYTPLSPETEYISDVIIYDEDNFINLKEKIYLVSDIPVYRQHLFFFDKKSFKIDTYKLFSNGLIAQNITNINNFNQKILDIPIDMKLYNERNNIKVHAEDTFMIINPDIKPINHVFYVVDLAEFTHKNHNIIKDEILPDTFSFDMLYYGFILKYWPMLTKECFYDFIVNESELQSKYPDLAKNKNSLRSIYKYESDVINDINENQEKLDNDPFMDDIYFAITHVVALTINNTIINIRNLFDCLQTSEYIPEIHAYETHENKKYLLKKQYSYLENSVKFPPGNLTKTGLTLAIVVNPLDKNGTIFLNIRTNGTCYLRAMWNEEDRYNFEDIVKIIKTHTDNVFNNINKLGKLVFISGKKYLQLFTKNNILFQGSNISIFWKKILTASAFKILQSQWDRYIKSKIITLKTTQGGEMIFHKGIYKYDIDSLDKILTAGNIVNIDNQYAYLSNNSIKQKWDQNYGGRIFTLTHRTTDIKLEVNGIYSQEFKIFYKFMVRFLYNAYNSEVMIKSINSVKNYDDLKKLKKLQELDPELYNLKKHGNKKVYSTLCQHKMQPNMYTEEELAAMTKEHKDKLTEYWNFTLNKPAYYGCPNKDYPHLSFIVGVHPKHYCLPCCSKNRPDLIEGKKTKINSICFERHEYLPDDNTTDGISHHISIYGREIDVGRLSKLPSNIKSLIGHNANYFLYGVDQHLPAITNVGIVFALAEMLSFTLPEFIMKIINQINKSNSDLLFNQLLSGRILDYFPNVKSLLSTMKTIFIDNKSLVNESRRFNNWSELFIELTYILFNSLTITFIDENNDENNIDLFISSQIKSALIYFNQLSDTLIDRMTKNIKFIFILKKQNNFYPIINTDPVKYFKTLDIDKKWFSYNDQLVISIRNITKSYNSNGTKTNKVINLGLIESFVKHNSKYQIKLKYINKQDLCYAMLLQNGKNLIYLPIDYSIHISDDNDMDDRHSKEITFLPFHHNDYKLNQDHLLDLINDINNYIKSQHSLGKDIFEYKLLIPDHYFKINKIISGFTVNNLLFYFNKPSNILKLPEIDLMFDYCDINKAIIERTPKTKDKTYTKIGEALYENYQYQLYLYEFINYINHEKNDVVRKKISKLMTEHDPRKYGAIFGEELEKILTDNTELHEVISTLIELIDDRSISIEGMIDKFNENHYKFDQSIMKRIKSLEYKEAISEIIKISHEFTIQKNIDFTNIEFPNIYSPCANDSLQYCDKKKLILTKSLDEFAKIIYDDLNNELKLRYLMSYFNTNNVIDWFQFNKYPAEIITINIIE